MEADCGLASPVSNSPRVRELADGCLAAYPNRHVLISEKTAVGAGPVTRDHLNLNLQRHGVSIERIRRAAGCSSEALTGRADLLHLARRGRRPRAGGRGHRPHRGRCGRARPGPAGPGPEYRRTGPADPRAERRRRLAEPDLEFRAFCTRRRLPASSTPQLERARDAWQAERYQRGEIDQRPGYTDNPFRPR